MGSSSSSGRHQQRRGGTMGSKHDGGATGGTATVAIQHTEATTTQRPAVRCGMTGRSVVVAVQWVAARWRGHDSWQCDGDTTGGSALRHDTWRRNRH